MAELNAAGRAECEPRDDRDACRRSSSLAATAAGRFRTSSSDCLAQERQTLYILPMPDLKKYQFARLNRDPAFDGVFFVGSITTGIYCRPVCPVKPPLEENIRYFQSAAAAKQAGFRPCLRCRPEAAPFSPAWRGTQATVERALRLIEEGALDTHGIETLAERLGVGGRHLSRLFERYVGASPGQVARTARIQRAKRLLDETDLPMVEIALQAGFGSLRRFNAAFRQVYGRPPSSIRSSQASTDGEEGDLRRRIEQ